MMEDGGLAEKEVRARVARKCASSARVHETADLDGRSAVRKHKDQIIKEKREFGL